MFSPRQGRPFPEAFLTLVLVRHFENTALDDTRKLFNENIANIDTDVQDVMKKILKTLEDGDFSKKT